MRTRAGAGLRAEGDFVLLIGSTHNDLGGTEYLKVEHGHVAGRPPALDLTREQAVNRVVLAAAQSGYLHSAHDCAEGGMLVALAECCLLGGIGDQAVLLMLWSAPRSRAAPLRTAGNGSGLCIVSQGVMSVPGQP